MKVTDFAVRGVSGAEISDEDGVKLTGVEGEEDRARPSRYEKDQVSWLRPEQGRPDQMKRIRLSKGTTESRRTRLVAAFCGASCGAFCLWV